MRKAFNRAAERLRQWFGKTPDGKPAKTGPRGHAVLNDPAANKSTAFTREERENLGLRGLLPHQVATQEEQEARIICQLRREPGDINKYVYLSALQDRNERLFYQTAINNIDEIMPLIYTPTVGEACQKFSHLYRNPRGLYITPDDKGHIREMLDNWSEEDVRAIVVTDGERILGLGDLGANGMGIPIGKLALYTICGGIDPAKTMPVMFDTGTDNQSLRADPLYQGYPHPRVRGAAYDDLMEEFIAAVKDKFPKAMVQFEDFKTENAFRLLDTYRGELPSFNDDIQGTAAVALAGVIASARVTGEDLRDARIMFLGAGSAATGIADLMVKELQSRGLTEEEARGRISLVDSKGLVTTGRETIAANKAPFAQDHAPADFLSAVKDIKPTILIGATGVAGGFTKEVVEAMAELNERPVIFALSNPTSHAECTAQQAYEWSGGRAVFASGSPFAPVERDGKTFTPGQANNAYVFPGIGLGVTLGEVTEVSDGMFLAAARTLADMTGEDDLAKGNLFPPLKEIRKVSAKIAEAVMETAAAENRLGIARPADIAGFIRKGMYDPSYGQPAPVPRKPGAKPPGCPPK
ncbi:MAG: oxaloacetate-decarboxylating malate dehydrogenase [Alphaproteobacteria bacterium]|nr:oxaloacetate-decarboxylating malate dehydrogenase [Alphaproteobacteria bacterium]